MLVSKRDRTTYYGGSDIPIIFGKSKFTTPFELALEKAGLKERDYKENIYILFGNYLEPRIQEIMDIENTDDKEYQIELKGVSLPIICHTDGIIGDIVQEIKVSSSDTKGIIEQYEYQLYTYLIANGLKKGRFVLLKRNEQDKKFIKELLDEYNLDYLHDFSNLTDGEIGQIRSRVKQYCLFKRELTKDDIETKEIKLTKKKENEITNQLKKFDKFVNYLKNDVLFDVDDLLECGQKEKELMIELGLTNDIVDYDLTQIEKFESQLVKLKQIENQAKEERKKLLDFMLENSIKKIDNDKFLISVKKSSERKTLDKAKFEAENGVIDDKYYKVSKTNESLIVKRRVKC